jgi:hypothetical protein
MQCTLRSSVDLRLWLLISCGMVVLFDSASAFRHHHGIYLNSINSKNTQSTDGYSNQKFLFEHLGHISHKRGSTRTRQRSLIKPRNAATISMDPWLSEKDVDTILREEGPGSMRPSPLTHAERYNSRDWLHNLASFSSALEFKRVKSFLLANTLFATIVWAACLIFPKTLKALTSGIGPQPHLLIGGVLGLLLIFRTNTAYDRFWEGRRLWSFLISRVREVRPARIFELHASARNPSRSTRIGNGVCSVASITYCHSRPSGSQSGTVTKPSYCASLPCMQVAYFTVA